MSRRPPLVFIFTVTLTGILNNTLVTPAIPDILSDLAVSDDRSGLLVASGSVAGIVVAPLIGILADRWGRRVVLTTCLTIFGACGLVAALAPTFGVLLIARFFQGVGSAGLINLAVVLIGDHWSGPGRTRLIGRNSAVLTVGLAALPLLSGAVTQAASWRWTFGIYTVALATAAAAWLVLDPWRPADPSTVRQQLREARTVVARPEIYVTYLIGFLVFVAIFGLFLTVFPLHLARSFGMEAGLRGVMIAVPAVTSTLAAYNLGRVRALLSVRSVVLAGSAALLVAFSLLGLASVVALIVAAALIYGLGEGALIPTIQDQAIESAPEQHRAAVLAVWVGAARLGQTSGPLLAAAALTVWDTGITLAAGSLVVLVMLIIGALGPLARHTAAPE